MGLLSQQARDTKARAGVKVVATGMHQTLAGGGIAQPGALLHWQRIHVHPQTHRGAVLRSQLGHHARATNSLTNPPTQLTQFTGDQGGGLVFLTAELRVGMQMPAQLQQLRQLTTEPIGKGRRLGHLRTPPRPGTPSDPPSAAVASGAPAAASRPGGNADPARPPRPSGFRLHHWILRARAGR